DEADLYAVRAEDVSERRGDDRLESILLQAPGCMLARGATPEVPPGEEDLRALRLATVELEVRVLRPVEEEELGEPRALDPLQELLGHDLVSVDVRAVEHRRARGD